MRNKTRTASFPSDSSGGTKTPWQSNQSKTDRQLVITESAIDAMSYHQLFGKENPHTRYIATSGTISNYQLELIKTAVTGITKLGGEIVIATDNDEIGNKMAKTLVKIAPEKSQVYRHKPQHSKDWNEFLQQVRQRKLTRHQQQRSIGWEL